MASSIAKADLPQVARGQLCPHIDDLDAGQRVAAVALGEPDELGAAILGGVKLSVLGGSAGQKGAGSRSPPPAAGPPRGRRTGARTRSGRVCSCSSSMTRPMFSSGAKDGAPGPHHDVGAAVLYHLPLDQTLGVVQGRVLDGHPPPEPALRRRII